MFQTGINSIYCIFYYNIGNGCCFCFLISIFILENTDIKKTVNLLYPMSENFLLVILQELDLCFLNENSTE